jgi:quercetin dioxygenase-like cupin family protein
MGEIVRIDEQRIPWLDYGPTGVREGRANVRVKALTARGAAAPPMQYVDYAPGHADRVHRHDEGEVFVVAEGELWLDDGTRHGAGSVLYIPRDTDYAVRAGEQGARFYRIVVP